ncbi:olfactory receptor 187-like isoform X2 [Tachyglossus aculeatus]|uniref:olfactory receptor 187-like isoform X2 n=1 Tax=Tachyglossus aculeatus TaxID=9261 RepID=UPI0018F60BA2|nr:olfactory receptor 187-like isoform X2 [Tachyglossus aculeatus]
MKLPSLRQSQCYSWNDSSFYQVLSFSITTERGQCGEMAEGTNTSMATFVLSGLTEHPELQVFTILTITISYSYILCTILRMKSAKGKHRTFSTCGAHLLSVTLFFGSLLFMYVRPGSTEAEDQDMMDSLFYTIIIPMLNPFIYSLRNKEVIGILRKVIRRQIFSE